MAKSQRRGNKEARKPKTAKSVNAGRRAAGLSADPRDASHASPCQ